MTTKKDRAKADDDMPAVLETPASSPRAEQTELPSKDVLLTAERAFSGAKRNPVVEAFLHTERSKRPTRKLTKSAWAAELAAFQAAPR